MRKKVRIIFLIIVLLSCGLSPNDSLAQDNQQIIKIGVLAQRGIQRALDQWEPTAEYLSRRIPEYKFIIIPLESNEVIHAIKKSKVDFIFASPSFYVELEMLYGANRLVTLKNLRTTGLHTVYGGVIFFKANRKDIKSIKDLKEKSFMAVDEMSLGGWHMALYEFKKNGIWPYRDFASLTFGKTHDAVVYAVLNEKVDAGTVRTDTLEQMAQEGKINIEDFRIIKHPEYYEHIKGHQHVEGFVHSTQLYPEWPFAKVKHTSQALADVVAMSLLNMPFHSPAALASDSAGWTVPLNYQPVHEILKDLKRGPYKNYGEITIWEAIRQHWTWFFVALLVILYLLFVTLRITYIYKKLKITEQEVFNQKSFLENVFESVSHPFYVIDANNYNIIMANSSALDEASTTMMKCYALTHKQDAPCEGEHPCPLVEVKKTKKPVVMEHVHFAKNGRRINVEVHGYPIFNDKGEVVQMIEYSLDITDRKEVERELMKHNQELEKMNRIMINRELKMIELKKEIKSFKK